MKTCRKLLPLVLLATAWLAGCAKKPEPPFPQNLPMAKKEVYMAIQDMGKWENPYITVYPDGIRLTGDATKIKVSELPQRLSKLPKTAWPYGKVVGVSQIGIRSGNDSQLIEALWKQTIDSLKALGLEVLLVPSA